MNIPWEIIIPQVIALIAECIQNNADEQALRGAFASPTPQQRMFVQWYVMRNIRPRDRFGRRKEIMDEVWARAAAMSEAEVEMILGQAYALAG